MNSQVKIINGTEIASRISQELRRKISGLADQPGLAVILVGTDPASYIYVGLKEQAAKEAGMKFEKDYYPATISQSNILEKIAELNSRPDIHGILVQFPLPKGFNENEIVAAIRPDKDVDGFHPENIKALLAGQPRIVPGLALGIVKLIESAQGLTPGKMAIIIANSGILSKPLAYLLQQRGLLVDSVSPQSNGLADQTSQADIVIVAVGRPNWLKAEMIKSDAVIIDVGYNRLNNRAVGDADFNSVSAKAGWITPVPGGVGPMTVAMLLQNVLRAYELQRP